MITYHMRLTSQRVISLTAQSAADAVQKALVLCPGDTVAECFSGCKDFHTITTPNGSYRSGPAFMVYEVPPHRAYVPCQKSAPPETDAFGFLADVPRKFENKEASI